MKNIDVAVVGGGLSGCFAAIKAARMGLKVALLEKSTLLGREFTAYHRTWINDDGYEEYAKQLREYLLDEDDVAPLFLGTVRKQLLKKLLESNVQVLFMSQVAGVLVSGERAEGLLIGNRYGLELLRAGNIIDMTEERSVIRLLKEESIAEDVYKVYYAVEFDDVAVPPQEYIAVSDGLGITGNRVKLHPGKKDQGNVTIEFSYEFCPDKEGVFNKSRIENKSRMIAQDLIIWLHKNHKSFYNALPVNIGYESYVERNTSQELPSWGYKGIYTIKDSLTWEFGWKDIFSIKKKAEECVGSIGTTNESNSVKTGQELIISGKSVIPLSECKISQLEDNGLNVGLESIRFNIQKFIKNKISCDILIAGGGTGGVMAGIAAGGKNKNTLLVEMHQDFGGTKTQGFVNGYWHGYRGGFTKATDDKIAALYEKMTGKENDVDRVARMLFYHKAIADTGCKFLLSAQICDVILDGKTVRGGLAVYDRGLVAIESKISVDATGEGDVVCFAGAAYSFGDARDGNMQSFSMWGMETRKVSHFRESYYLKDIDVIAQDKYSELLRGIFEAHRVNSPYFFSSMLTVREGRQIQGEYVLNLKDILDGREFNDCIAVAFCPLDTHGRKSSLLSLVGFFSFMGDKDIKVRIPLRSLIPKGIHGIMVIAKSISATRDAASLCRMTADIQNRGYACGIAAAMAVSEDCDIRDIPIGTLQKQLLEEEILPDWTFEKTELLPVEKSITFLKKGNLEAFFNVLRMPREEVKPLLAKEFLNASGNERLYLAKALAWFGSEAGSALLMDELRALLDMEITSTDVQCIDGEKDRLSVPWEINQIITLMGMSGDKRALDMICDIIEKTGAGGPPEVKDTPYRAGRMDIQLIPRYERIICLLFAVERLADKKAIPALEKLMAREYIGGRYISESIYKVSNFFSAYLELKIAAVLARCGGKTGVRLLIEYLKDINYILRTFAYGELKCVSGRNFGMDSSKWSQWLEQTGDLEEKPYFYGEV